MLENFKKNKNTSSPYLSLCVVIDNIVVKLVQYITLSVLPCFPENKSVDFVLILAPKKNVRFILERVLFFVYKNIQFFYQ